MFPALFDFFAVIFYSIAIFSLLRPSSNKLFGHCRFFILTLVGLLLFIYTVSFIEWSGMTAVLTSDTENFEDYMQVLVPFLWGGLFYSLLQRSSYEEIRQSEEHLRGLIENMPVLLVAFDGKGRIKAWNKHAAEISGFSFEQLTQDESALQKIFPDGSYRETQLQDCQFGGGQYEDWVWPMRHRDGQQRYISWYNISKNYPVPGWSNWAIGIDLTDRVQAEKDLRHLATHDSLTSLANRAVMENEIEKAIKEARRTGKMGAVILVDLDNFKYLNDSLGHPVGDKLLCELAERLQKIIKPGDFIARFGGDEFVFLLRELNDLTEVAAVSERILSEIRKPSDLYGNRHQSSASMGGSVFPYDSEHVTELIKNADLAMYSVKHDGGDGFRFFTNDMNKKVLRQHIVADRLRQALKDQSFALYYQPQVNIQDDNFHAVEALIRLPNDNMKLGPAEFIPIAEKTGLINEIDHWVLINAFQQVNEWQSNQIPIRVSINLSTIQFHRPDFVEQVDRFSQEYAISPEGIEFEITEGMLIRDVDTALSNMKKIRDLGFTLSIDDFGTGYSSLSYLKQFPISKLKIDKIFLYRLSTNIANQSIIRGIIQLGHSLGLDVLTEGVENESQKKFLHNEGCDLIQGYYYSRAIPGEKIPQWQPNQPQLH